MQINNAPDSKTIQVEYWLIDLFPVLGRRIRTTNSMSRHIIIIISPRDRISYA